MADHAYCPFSGMSVSAAQLLDSLARHASQLVTAWHDGMNMIRKMPKGQHHANAAQYEKVQCSTQCRLYALHPLLPQVLPQCP